MIGFLFRFYYYIFPCYFNIFQIIFIILGIFSIFFGTLGALYQKKLKKLFAYSGMVNIGFILLGFATGTFLGIISSFFYLIIYVILNLNFFSIIFSTRKIISLKKFKTLEDLSVLYKTDVFLCLNLSLNLFSFAGIPPLAGFFSKFYIIFSLLSVKFYFISFLVVCLSVISSIYYLRLLKIMFFEKPIK
jgi:NADH-quinone oxidoreductase subunit N